jgi:hypothetical protein
MNDTVKNVSGKLALRCSACGATTEAACDCGVGYIPAGEYAIKLATEHPELSTRMIAEKSGVGYGTIHRARKSVDPNGSTEPQVGTVKSTDPNGSVEPHGKRVGKDGKLYKASKPARPSKPDPVRETVRANPTLPIADLVQQAGVGARRIGTVKREERIREEVRKEALEEVGAVAKRMGLSLTQQSKLDAYRRELEARFEVEREEWKRAYDKELNAKVAQLAQEQHGYDMQQVKKVQDALNVHKKPFNNDEYRDLLMALHPDNSDPVKRTDMFILVKQREFQLRNADEHDLRRKYNRMGIPPLPKDMEELLAQRELRQQELRLQRIETIKRKAEQTKAVADKLQTARS